MKITADMNSETFAQFLKTPAYLYRISYQELKSLVVQYPYCQNLRYLLLKKSQADQHPEYERNLEMAATYSINRGFLYEQLYSDDNNQINRESNVVIVENDLLELKDLEKLNLEPQKEVLLAEIKENTDTVNSTPIVTAPTPLELPKIEVEEILEGDISSDELPDLTDSSIDDLFSESEEEELVVPDLNPPDEGHQISEVLESEEDVLIENTLIENTLGQDLDITHEIDEEDIPEVLPEASSDELEDLFAEEPELPPVVQDNSSLGLDAMPNTDVEEAPKTEETVEDLLENVATGAGAVSIATIIAQVPAANDEEIIEEKLAAIEDLDIDKKDINPATIDITDLSPVSQKKVEEEEEIEEVETELISPQSSFSNWLKQFNSPQISVEIEDLDEKNEKKKVNYKYELVKGEWKQIKTKVKKKKKKSKAELIAAESVKLSKDVATETLAQLLEKQEHYAKAIKMYERLRLENPEKSDYFAARIETLQLKL